MKQYKVIIADDESAIRRGLVNSIPWKEMGFEVSADFMDGGHVIDYLQSHDADVVFTDVLMCNVTGLDVAKWVHNNRKSIKVILISGYKEFHYAQEAMKYGVVSYVLKPIDLNTICDVFQRVRQMLDEAYSSKELAWSGTLGWRDDPACRKVLGLEEELVKELISGERQNYLSCLDAWSSAIQKVSTPYFPAMVVHSLDAVYESLDQLKIAISADNEKVNMIRSIKNVPVELALNEVENIFGKLFLEINRRRNAPSEDMLTKVRKYIDCHLSENFGVEQLSDYVGLNRSYFSRMFKASTGFNVSEYILQRRISHALEYLKSGEYSVMEISKLLGYHDVKYFKKVFKQYTGYTVSEYKNMTRCSMENDNEKIDP